MVEVSVLLISIMLVHVVHAVTNINKGIYTNMCRLSTVLVESTIGCLSLSAK